MGAGKVQLVKWGNSHAIRLSKLVLQRAEISEGDELEIEVEKGRISLHPSVAKPTLQDLVAQIKPRNLHGEQDWGQRAGREVW